MILALDEGFLLRVSLAPQTFACCVRDASSPVADRFSKTGLTFLGVTRTTCGSKSRAKVAVGVPSRAFTRSFGCWIRDKLEVPAVTCCNPLLFRPSSTPCHRCEIRTRLECPYGSVGSVGNWVLRRRSSRPKSRATFHPQRPRPSTLRHPAKGDGCSTTEVLSTAWNRCRSRLTPLAVGHRQVLHPRGLLFWFLLAKERALADWRGHAFGYRTLLPGFDYAKQCPLLEGPLAGHRFDFVSPINFARGSRLGVVQLGRPGPVKRELALLSIRVADPV